MEKVVLFGNTQVAFLQYWYLTYDSQYEVAAFTVDRKYINEDKLFGLPVVPFEEIEHAFPPNEFKMVVGLGFRNVNKLRAEKYAGAKEKGYELISYISSKATTWPGLIIGENCFIYENTVIAPFAEIGNNVNIGAGSIISHHSVIKDHCFIGPNVVILGSATIEPYCVIGANAIIRDAGIIVARKCIIGAGSLINKNTREKGVYIGNSARLVPKNSDELSTWLTWEVKTKK